MAPITHHLPPISRDGELNSRAADSANAVQRRLLRRLAVFAVVAAMVIATVVVALIVWHVNSTDGPPALDFSPLTTVAP
jgi:hypothetical protein